MALRWTNDDQNPIISLIVEIESLQDSVVIVSNNNVLKGHMQKIERNFFTFNDIVSHSSTFFFL